MCECLQWQNAFINILLAIYVPKCSSYFNIHRGHEITRREKDRNVPTVSSDNSIYSPSSSSLNLCTIFHLPSFVIPHGWLYTLITNNNTPTNSHHCTLSPSYRIQSPCHVTPDISQFCVWIIPPHNSVFPFAQDATLSSSPYPLEHYLKYLFAVWLLRCHATAPLEQQHSAGLPLRVK